MLKNRDHRETRTWKTFVIRNHFVESEITRGSKKIQLDFSDIRDLLKCNEYAIIFLRNSVFNRTGLGFSAFEMNASGPGNYRYITIECAHMKETFHSRGIKFKLAMLAPEGYIRSVRAFQRESPYCTCHAPVSKLLREFMLLSMRARKGAYRTPTDVRFCIKRRPASSCCIVTLQYGE